MINHARTLLINVDGANSQRQNTGEEYIPPEFAPVQLPAHLISARRILLGTNPDRYFLNYRVRELMHYLHQTELADYVYALDPRVTYWPEQDAPFFDAEQRITTEKITGPADTQLFFQGNPIADNSRGRCFAEFVVSVINDGPNMAVQITGTEMEEQNTLINAGETLSGLSALGRTGVNCRVSKPVAGSRWRVTTLAKPAPIITTGIPSLELIGEPTILELFGVLTSEEPYVTFQNLWNDHKNPVYRLGGFVLALIYRTEEIRRRANG